MDFREATDRATEACITLAAIAEALGVAENTVARARMDAGNPNSRPAPEGWQPVLAKLARRRGGELVKLADQLEREGRRK